MLRENNFYKITQIIALENGLKASIQINATHEIFKGHFPTNPVVPGVCMIQIVKELLELQTQKSFLFQKGNQLKFLQLLIPNDDAIEVNISWKIEEGNYNCNADFKRDAEVVFKLSGLFKA